MPDLYEAPAVWWFVENKKQDCKAGRPYPFWVEEEEE